jgi:hypothetical protein
VLIDNATKKLLSIQGAVTAPKDKRDVFDDSLDTLGLGANVQSGSTEAHDSHHAVGVPTHFAHSTSRLSSQFACQSIGNSKNDPFVLAKELFCKKRMDRFAPLGFWRMWDQDWKPQLGQHFYWNRLLFNQRLLMLVRLIFRKRFNSGEECPLSNWTRTGALVFRYFKTQCGGGVFLIGRCFLNANFTDKEIAMSNMAATFQWDVIKPEQLMLKAVQMAAFGANQQLGPPQ